MSFNYALRPIVLQKITMAGSAASLASAAFGAGTEYVRVAASTDFHIVFGASPTATADHIFITSDHTDILKVSPGEKVAALGGNSEVISIVEMSA